RFGVTEENWQEQVKRDPHFAESETPLFVGRAIAALAADRQHWRKNAMALTSWDLSDEYGFADADGRRPHWGRYIAGQVDERWVGLAQEARAAFERKGVPPDTIEVDRSALTLRARVGKGETPSDWVSRPVLEPELFMMEPARIASELVEKYERALSP